MWMLANSLIDGFIGSNFTGQALVLIQLACSVVMVSAALGKFRQFSRVKHSTHRLTRDIMGGRQVLEYYLARHDSTHSAVENIYMATCARMLKLLKPDDRARVMSRTTTTVTSAALTSHEAGLVKAQCEHVLEDEENALEYGMGAISTVVALAPMLGLLGTVWGVLDAFAEMGAAQTTTISQIAPAISAALVTTVVGLLVAIPGVIMFGLLNARKQALMTDLESFADDFTGRIANEFQALGGND